MDQASIVEDTERTRVCPQTDGLRDAETDKMEPIYLLSTSMKRGYNKDTAVEYTGFTPHLLHRLPILIHSRKVTQIRGPFCLPRDYLNQHQDKDMDK